MRALPAPQLPPPLQAKQSLSAPPPSQVLPPLARQLLAPLPCVRLHRRAPLAAMATSAGNEGELFLGSKVTVQTGRTIIEPAG